MTDDTSGLPEVPAGRIPAFNRYLGIESVRAAGGRSRMELELRSEFMNQRGVSHGGLIAALLDSALGAAVVSAIAPEEWCGTVQLDVQFQAPGRGARLVCSGEMVRRGSRIAFARGEVIDDRGRTVASAQGTWHIWPSHPDSPRDEGQRRD